MPFDHNGSPSDSVLARDNEEFADEEERVYKHREAGDMEPQPTGSDAMTKPNDGGTAFPVPMGADWPECDRGLSLRDYFAAAAATGIMANARFGEANANDIALWSYGQADAMMRERDRKDDSDVS